MTTKVKTKEKKRSRECNFQYIPHWDDPEIGYKALLQNIRTYVNYKYDEFVRLAPVITIDEFIWDTFSNMCRRNGYPQYDPNKNKGNFYSFVQTCCERNQADWAKKRNVRARQLAELQGITFPEGTTHPEYHPILNLDEFIVDSDDQSKHEKIAGEVIDGYTESLAFQEIIENVSNSKISDKFWLSWKQFATLIMKGWSVVDISKQLEVNPTTTRKYFAQLRETLAKNEKIQDLLKANGITLTEKTKK